MERSWPLTGRDEQLRGIAAAIRPGRAGIVVAGPAGVGKTRLAREAVTASGLAPSAAWALGSAAARPLPLGAFAGLLDVPPGDPLEVVARALEELDRRRPSVLVVDDAHQLDEHSAIVLHRAVVRGIAAVLVTLRTGEPAPDPVTALWKDELVPRLDLQHLDAERTTALVARVLGGPVDSAAAQRLWHLTEGSPLFLRHLLAGEVAARRFTASSGVWRWDSEPEISPELADLLEHEIGDLEPGVRDVVDLVALAEPVAATTLASLTSGADIEQAEARGLVRADGVVVRLAHPLYGEVRRAAMGTVRARRLRGRVAVTLDPSPSPIARAVLTLDSDLEADPDLFLRAAEAATRMYDLPLAERLARAAAASGDLRARMVHAAALSWLSRGDEAEETLAALATRAPDPPTRALVHLHRTGNLLFTLARPDDARRALDAAGSTGALSLHVAAMTTALDAADGDLAAVLGRGPALLRSPLPDDLARILAASGTSAAAAVTGRRELLDAAAQVGGLTAERVPAVIPGFGLADFQVLGHRLHGTPQVGGALAERLHTASADLPGPARLMGLVIAGHAALASGRVRDAIALLTEAWAGFAASRHEFRFRCRTLLATALAQAGRGSEAAPLVEALVREQHPAYRLFRPDDVLARAWGAAAVGATTEASARAVEAADLAHDQGSPAYEVLAWQTVVQFGDATAALPWLAPLEVLGPRAGAALAHARALAEADGAALLEVAESWVGIGDLLAAGDAFAQAADVHRRAGRRGSFLTVSARARRIVERSGARTPALDLAVRPLPLTTREREIVTLAAHGRSNRDIAADLTLSVRTVEGHLYRAGHKLGVSERADLAGLLGIE